MLPLESAALAVSYLTSKHPPICLALLVLFFIPGCFRNETPEEAKASYAANVESCACRFLFTEEDNYSGLSYAAILDECNQVVHRGNASRYDSALVSRPSIDALPCGLEVREWKAMIAEELRRRQVREQLFGAKLQSGSEQHVSSPAIPEQQEVD